MTPYPGTPVLDWIFAGLRGQGWTSVERLKRRFLPSPGVTKSFGRWEDWENVGGGQTYVRAEQWRNENGDLVSYVFWYTTPARTALEAVSTFCPASVVNKYACHHPAAKPQDPRKYSLLVQITDVQPIGKDYKVNAKLQNDDRQPVLVGISGALTDGKPNLWVLGVEQEEKPGDWKSVDAICPESPAPDFVVLQPGESIESWVMAVEFPDTNHRFGVCRREVAHLHGRIRASIRYYTDPCEVEHPFNSPVYSSTSGSVEYPSARQ